MALTEEAIHDHQIALFTKDCEELEKQEIPLIGLLNTQCGQFMPNNMENENVTI